MTLEANELAELIKAIMDRNDKKIIDLEGHIRDLYASKPSIAGQEITREEVDLILAHRKGKK